MVKDGSRLRPSRRAGERERPERRALLAIGATLLLFFGLGCQAVAANGVAELVGKGVSSYDKGHFTAAARQFATALSRDPSSPRVAYDLGAAELGQGNDKKALTYLEQAENSPDAAGSLQAAASYDKGEAYAALGAAADADPSAALAYYRKSARAFHHALEISPSRSAAAYNLDIVRRRIKRLEGVVQGSSGSSAGAKGGSPGKRGGGGAKGVSPGKRGGGAGGAKGALSAPRRGR